MDVRECHLLHGIFAGLIVGNLLALAGGYGAGTATTILFCVSVGLVVGVIRDHFFTR